MKLSMIPYFNTKTVHNITKKLCTSKILSTYILSQSQSLSHQHYGEVAQHQIHLHFRWCFCQRCFRKKRGGKNTEDTSSLIFQPGSVVLGIVFRRKVGCLGYFSGLLISLSIRVSLTSPNAPLPITFKDSKSSKPSLVLFRRRNSVSFRACADLLILFQLF